LVALEGGKVVVLEEAVGKATSTWHRIVQDPTKDVLLVATKGEKSCPNNSECGVLRAYLGGVARRFHELKINSVIVATLDAQKVPIPQTAHLSLQSLPAIYLIPAKNKLPPYVMFTGKLKPRYLMHFVEKHASIKFQLPDLPHLTAAQQVDFHKQLAEQNKKQEPATESERAAKSETRKGETKEL